MIESSTIRILTSDGKTVGTGFLVAKDLAVTCAHVVAATGAVDGDTIQVQFTERGEKIEAEVLPKYWRDTKNGDVAFLRLLKQIPDGIAPVRLGLAEHSHDGNIFRSFGYATAAGMQGIKANGTIDGYLREHKLVQFQSPQANHGISGAPVLDEKRGVVVGMITKGHNELGRNEQTTFATPAEVLFEICPEIRPSEICPYLGLKTFSEETTDFFFGRGALTEELLGRLRDGCRFLAVFGPSGSGKSSVVRAGLLPALAKGQVPGSHKWAQIAVRPADDPFAQIKAAGLESLDIQQYLKSHEDVERVALFIDQFEELFTCPEELRERFARDLAAALKNSRLILILTMRDDFYSAFNAEAAPLAGSPYKTVVDVPVTLQDADLIAMIEGPAEAVGLAFEQGLVRTIFENACETDQTKGQARSTILPLLEFALTQLWELRKDGRLTHEAYRTIGGVTGSLAIWADDAYSRLPEDHQALTESLLLRLVHLGDEAQGLPDTRRRGMRTEFDETDSHVIEHFANSRLLVTSGETVELVHDALLDKWHMLRGWLDDNRRFLVWRQKITGKFQEWKDRNGELLRGRELAEAQGYLKERPNDLSKLADYISSSARRQRRQSNLLIGMTFVVLLIFAGLAIWGQSNAVNASNQAATAVAAQTIAVGEANMRATAQADAEAQKAEAEKQSQIAHAGELAAYSSGHYQIEYDLALLLGLEANHSLDNNFTKASLITIKESNPYLYEDIQINDGWVNSVAFDSHSKVLAAGSRSGTVTLWNIGYPSFQQYRPLTRSDPANISVAVTKIAFRPGVDKDTTLAVGYSDGQIILWDYATAEPSQTLVDHQNYLSALAFSADGRYIASADESGHVCLWDMQVSMPTCQTLVDAHGKIWQLAFLPKTDGSFSLAGAGGADNSIFVWEMPTGKLMVQEKDANEGQQIYSFAVDSTGKIFATGDQSSKIKIWQWDKSKLSETQTLSGRHTYWVISLKFIPNPDLSGDWLASGSADHDTILWQADGEKFSFKRKLQAHSGYPLDLEYDPNNELLASGGSDGKLILWLPWTPNTMDKNTTAFNPIIAASDFIASDVAASNVDSIIAYTNAQTVHVIYSDIYATPVCVFSVQENYSISALALQPKKGPGRLVAVGSDDGQIELHDLDQPDCPQVGSVLETGGKINHLAFDYTGTYLASARESQTSGDIASNALIWNVADPQNARIEQQLGATTSVRAVAFSPSQSLLAYAVGQGSESVIALWDVKNAKLQSILASGNAHTNNIWSLAFSPDGKMLASASADTYVKLWDVKTEKFLVDFIGHKNGVTGLDFSPAGDVLASIDRNGKLILWDVEKRQLLVSLDTGYDSQNSFYTPRVLYSTNGNILSSDGSSTITIWDMDLSHLRVRACEVVNRNLSGSERADYQMAGQGEACPGADAGALLTQGYLSAIQHDQSSADQAFMQATQKALASEDINIENSVCWFGSLNGSAKIVMPACDDMVENTARDDTNLSYFRDSRAVARALIGDYEGAIEDEEAFVKYYEARVKPFQDAGEQYQEIATACQKFIDNRKDWIEKFKQAVNPFDDATLEDLRFEILPPC